MLVMHRLRTAGKLDSWYVFVMHKLRTVGNVGKKGKKGNI